MRGIALDGFKSYTYRTVTGVILITVWSTTRLSTRTVTPLGDIIRKHGVKLTNLIIDDLYNRTKSTLNNSRNASFCCYHCKACFEM